MFKNNIFNYFLTERPLKIFTDKIWFDNNKNLKYEY